MLKDYAGSRGGRLIIHGWEVLGSVTIGSFSLTRDGALFFLLFLFSSFFFFHMPIFYGELWQSGEQKIDSRSASTDGGQPAAVSDSLDCPFSPRAGLSVYKSAPRLLPSSIRRSIRFAQLCRLCDVFRPFLWKIR